jgi:hypothetical protein
MKVVYYASPRAQLLLMPEQVQVVGHTGLVEFGQNAASVSELQDARVHDEIEYEGDLTIDQLCWETLRVYPEEEYVGQGYYIVKE